MPGIWLHLGLHWLLCGCEQPCWLCTFKSKKTSPSNILTKRCGITNSINNIWMCFFFPRPLNFSPHWKLIHLFALSVCAVSKLFSSRGEIFPNNGIKVFSRNLTGRTQNNNLGSLLDLKTILKIEILEIISQIAKRVDIMEWQGSHND